LPRKRIRKSKDSFVAFDDHLTNGKVIGMVNVGGDPTKKYEGGLTKNMKKFAIQGADGSVKDVFFKSIFDDSFIYKGNFLRMEMKGKKGHITLNDMENNPLSKDDHMYLETQLRDKNVPYGKKKEIFDSHKGWMVNRELASLALGKMLKMDHLPEGSIREITTRKPNGESMQELGFVSENLVQKLAEDGAIIKTGVETVGGLGDNGIFDNIAATDKKFGDKILFDYLIGNTDRHQNNFFAKRTQQAGKTHYEMLGFDHGLSFGKSNKDTLNNIYYGFNGQAGPAVQLKYQSQFTTVTKEFVNAVNDVINDFYDNNGGKFKELTDFIEQKIGKNESDSFKDRFADVVEGLLANNDKNADSIIRAASKCYV